MKNSKNHYHKRHIWNKTTERHKNHPKTKKNWIISRRWTTTEKSVRHFKCVRRVFFVFIDDETRSRQNSFRKPISSNGYGKKNILSRGMTRITNKEQTKIYRLENDIIRPLKKCGKCVAILNYGQCERTTNVRYYDLLWFYPFTLKRNGVCEWNDGGKKFEGPHQKGITNQWNSWKNRSTMRGRRRVEKILAAWDRKTEEQTMRHNFVCLWFWFVVASFFEFFRWF